MKRSSLFVGGFVVLLFFVMQYALFQAERVPGDEISVSKAPSVVGSDDVREGLSEQERSEFVTSTVLFSSSTLGVRLTIPTSDGLFLWKEEKPTSNAYAQFRVIALHEPNGSISCVASLAVVPGPIAGVMSSVLTENAYQVAGNDRVHLETTKKTLCNARGVFEVGPKIEATYVTRPLVSGTVSLSNKDTCTDYRLETPLPERGGVAPMTSFADHAVDLPLMGGQSLRGQDGLCVPFSLRFAPIPGSAQYVVYQRSIAERGPYELAIGVIDPRDSSKNTIFSWPAVVRHDVSPDQRFLAKVYEILVGQTTRYQLTIEELSTGKSLLPNGVLIASGRRVDLSVDEADLLASPFEWNGRTVRVTTVDEKTGQNPKIMNLSF